MGKEKISKELWDLMDKYEARFNKFFGTIPWYLDSGKWAKAKEVIKRCLERGSPVTSEEYYIEICGFDKEEYEQIMKGEILF